MALHVLLCHVLRDDCCFCSAESTSAAVAAAQSLEHLHAPEVTVKAAPVKKKGAVIGSAPKLSHEGLVAAAKAAEEKAAAEALAAKKAKLLEAKKAATAAAKANRQKSKLAVPGGGIGFHGSDAPQSVEVPDGLQAGIAPHVQPNAVPQADAGSVVGRIHQGKWSRKKQ